MTQQAPDRLCLRGQRYWIAGVDGALIDPHDLGVHPDSYSTGCYRGYISTYACEGGSILLCDLEVFTLSPPPPINGIRAVHDPKLHSLYLYSALNVPCPLVRRLAIVRELEHREFSGVTPQPPCYDVVLELVVDRGLIVEERDHSGAMIEVRERVRSFGAAHPIETWSKRDFEEYRRLSWSFAAPMRDQPPVFRERRR